MNFDLTEREARLLRAQLVRYIVELEDELARSATQNLLERALASEIRTLHDLYTRLTSMLDPEAPAPGYAAKYAP